MANVTITINENDSYGDGWQGQWVRIFDSNGVEVAAHTLESGSSGSDTFTLSDGADYTWTFGEGSWIEEASFTMVRDDTGEVLAQASGVAASGSFTLSEAGESPSADISTGLVSRWSFESDASDSVGDNDGTLFGATIDEGYAELNGTSGEFLLDESLGDLWGSDASFSMWLKTTAGSGMVYMVREAYSGSSKSYLASPIQAAGNVIVGWRSKQGADATQPVYAETVVNDGTWHMLTYVRSGSSLHFYVDGQLEGTLTNITGSFLSDVPVRIGSYSANSTNPSGWLDASIDDLRKWNRALTSADVTALYDAGRDPVEAPAGDYVMTALDGTTDAPTGDVGFAKGDEDGFFIFSDQAYEVYYQVNGAWDQNEGNYLNGMAFEWIPNATRAYVKFSVADQTGYYFTRSLDVGIMSDSDDPDAEIDAFKGTGFNFAVSEHTATVSGQDPIVIAQGGASFVQVVEDDSVVEDYTIQLGATETTVTPPAGRDGAALKIRIFTGV